MELDEGCGTITRRTWTLNGRGEKVTDGEPVKHCVQCRVSNEVESVWRNGAWVGGVTLDAAPCVFARHCADIAEGDTLEWRGKSYEVGPVTRPSLDGGAVALQARLTEVVP
jgi:hypothetical protein